MFNKSKLIGFLFLVSCILIAACGQNQQAKDAEPSAAKEPPRDSLTIRLTGSDSVSVFDLLRRSHDVDYQSSAMGVFVKAIDSISSHDHYFWVYSVNDTMARMAADKYLTSDSDRVVWHFRRVGQ